MSDSTTDDSPSEDGPKEVATADGGIPKPDVTTAGGDSEAEDTTAGGASEADDANEEAEKQKRRISLSERLRKIASKSASKRSASRGDDRGSEGTDDDEADRAPPDKTSSAPASSDDDLTGTDQEEGAEEEYAQTDRISSLPFDVLEGTFDDETADSAQSPDSNAASHSPDPDSGAPSSSEPQDTDPDISPASEPQDTTPDVSPVSGSLDTDPDISSASAPPDTNPDVSPVSEPLDTDSDDPSASDALDTDPDRRIPNTAESPDDGSASPEPEDDATATEREDLPADAVADDAVAPKQVLSPAAPSSTTDVPGDDDAVERTAKLGADEISSFSRSDASQASKADRKPQHDSPPRDHSPTEPGGLPFDGEDLSPSTGLAEDTNADPPPEPNGLAQGNTDGAPPQDPSQPTVDTFDEPQDAPPDDPPLQGTASDATSPGPSSRSPSPEDHTAPNLTPDDGADEFEVESTELFQSPYENEPITPRITTLEGPVTGQDFLLHRMRNSVGRGSNNTITVSDPSMSRKHFEIVQKSDESFAIRDLMAVNGTSLNGVDIKEADLFHGDRIAAGHSVFQFLIPGDVPVGNRDRHLVPAANTKTVSAKSADELDASTADGTSDDTGLDKILMTVTIIAAVLSIPLFVFLLHTITGDDEPEPEASAYELYFEGVDALQNQRWDQAETYFKKSHQSDPEFGEIDAQLSHIEEERNAQRLVERARDELREGVDPDQLDELRAISHTSSYYDEAQSLLNLAETEEARILFERAQAAFDDEDYERSAEKLAELQAIVPQHEGAEDLQSDLEVAVDAESPEEESEESPAEERDSPQPQAAAPRTRPSPDPPPAEEPAGDDSSGLLLDHSLDSASPSSGGSDGPRAADINFTDGFTHYRAERFDEAIAHFDTIADASSGALAARAERTADAIRTFEQALQAGHDAHDAGQYASAADHFEQARQADQAVARAFDDRLAADLASSLAHQGLNKLDDHRYMEASKLLQQARAHHSSQQDVQSLEQALRRQANALYVRAADKRESDPKGAAELCRTIVTMVPPSNESHQRAKNLLDVLEN